MTYEQFFSGRLALMRAQRHIAQASIVPNVALLYLRLGPPPSFTTPDMEEAYFIVERLLCDLEKEFDAKVKKHRSQAKRKALEYRANRQVHL